MGHSEQTTPISHLILTGWLTSKLLADGLEIGNNGLDTVSFAFNLGLDQIHLVPVERIGNITANVDTHFGNVAAGRLYGKIIISRYRQRISRRIPRTKQLVFEESIQLVRRGVR